MASMLRMLRDRASGAVEVLEAAVHKGMRASRIAQALREVDKAATIVNRAERKLQVQAPVSLAVAIPAVVLVLSPCFVDVE